MLLKTNLSNVSEVEIYDILRAIVYIFPIYGLERLFELNLNTIDSISSANIMDKVFEVI